MNEDMLLKILMMLKEDLHEIDKSILNLNNAITVRSTERERVVEAISEIEEMLNNG